VSRKCKREEGKESHAPKDSTTPEKGKQNKKKGAMHEKGQRDDTSKSRKLNEERREVV